MLISLFEKLGGPLWTIMTSVLGSQSPFGKDSSELV